MLPLPSTIPIHAHVYSRDGGKKRVAGSEGGGGEGRERRKWASLSDNTPGGIGAPAHTPALSSIRISKKKSFQNPLHSLLFSTPVAAARALKHCLSDGTREEEGEEEMEEAKPKELPSPIPLLVSAICFDTSLEEGS